jgi:carbohydrate esterase-like sialic acid-specific acetylesterase
MRLASRVALGRRRGASAPVIPTYLTMFHTPLSSGESGTGGRAFYIDPAGNNSNSGTGPWAAWQNWTAVTSYVAGPGFLPGDRILFKRGVQHNTSGGNFVNMDGSTGNPIIIGAYGNGTPPVIANTGVTLVSGVDTATYSTCFFVEATASYVTIRDLKCANGALGNIFENGIQVSGTNVIIDNCEITGSGHGIWLGDNLGTSINATVQNCYIHDLTMVVKNTSNPDDDYGAVGIVCSGSDLIVRRNTIINAIAQSYDYGNDGAGIELWRTVNNLHVYQNFVDNAANFTEFGGINTDTVSNVVFEHNVVSRLKGVVGWFHNGGSNFALGSLSNVSFINNVFYVPNTATTPMIQVLGFSSSDASWLTIRNNIFSINYLNDWDSTSTNYVHSYNLYHYTSGNFRAGYLASANEYTGDPLFIHAPGRDLRLMAGSAALGRGTPVPGYMTDYTGTSFSGDATPDIGAVQGTFTAAAVTYTTDYNWSTATLVARETISRSSTALRFNSAGVRETAQLNVMRFDYSPVSPYPYLGVRVEPVSANLLQQSSTLAPPWYLNNTTVTNAATPGLDGFTPMKLVTTTAASGSRVEQGTAASAFTAGSQITLTLYIKKGTLDWIFTSIQKPDFSAGSHSWFNLTTGVFGEGGGPGYVAATIPIVSRTVRSLNNGIFELKLTYNTTGMTGVICQISADNGNGNFAGLLNGTFLLDGVQLEVGAGSSYIPALATVETRPAEILSVPLANGTYNIVVQDSAGQETRSGIVISNGAYTATPRSGQTHITRVTATLAATTSATVSLADLINKRVYQRQSNIAAIPLSGTYTSTPGSIEARLISDDGVTEVSGWIAVATSLAGGTWSGSLTAPQGGWYKVQVRPQTNATNVATSGNIIGVGDIWLFVGQSQQAMMSTDSASPPAADSRVVYFDGTSTWASPGTIAGTNGNGGIRFLNLMRSTTGVPQAIIPGATPETAITDWEETDTAYTTARSKLVAAGSVAGILWHQGGTGVGAITKPDYKTRLADLRTRFEAAASVQRFGVYPLMYRQLNGATDLQVQEIRRAHYEYIAENSGTVNLGWEPGFTLIDAVHTNPAGSELIGYQYAQALLYKLGDITQNNLGPSITGVTRSGTVLTLTVQHTNGTSLKINSGSQATGFQVFPRGAAHVDANALAISSIALGTNTITITLSANPNSAVDVYYQYGSWDNTSPVYDNATILGRTVGNALQPLMSPVQSAFEAAALTATGFDGTNTSAGRITFADSASFDMPDASWTLGFIVKVPSNAGTVGNYVFSTGAYQAANSLNVLFWEASSATTPNTLSVAFMGADNTPYNVNTPSVSALLDGTWRLWTIERVKGTGTTTINIYQTPIGAAQTRSLVHTQVTQFLTTISPPGGASGVPTLATRAITPTDRYLNGAMYLAFQMDGTLTATETQNLAAGQDLMTNLSKTPRWYVKLTGTGPTFTDLSGNGNTATVGGTVTQTTGPTFPT